MKAEAVSAFPRCEAVREDPCQVFRLNADAIVGDIDFEESAGGDACAEPDLFVRAISLVASVLGVTDQVNEDLQNLVFIGPDLGVGLKVFDNADAMFS